MIFKNKRFNIKLLVIGISMVIIILIIGSRLKYINNYNKKKSVNLNSKKYINVAYSKTLNLKDMNSAIKNGNVIMISNIDAKTGKSNDEVYNINKLDEFIKSYKAGKDSKVRIIKYARQDSKIWINQLYDLEYKENKLYVISYNTYGNGNKEKIQVYGIEKISSGNMIRYAILQNKNTPNNMGATLISFPMDSVKSN